MKKIISLLLAFACIFSLCACGSKEEPAATQSAPSNMTSALPGSNLQTDSSSETDDSTFKLAESFVEKSVDELISAIGEPISREYSSSCLGDGEDGNLEYDGFFVYTYKEGEVETVKQVYR